MKLGKNQAIALAYLAKKGPHAPTWSDRPWQFSTSQYRSILESLVRKDLAVQLDSGVVQVVLANNRVPFYTPNFEITPLGEDHLS